MVFRRIDEPDEPDVTITAYDPKFVKALAGYWMTPGMNVWTNSDNLALYAMARYIQKDIGNRYPHLPLSGGPPDRINREYTLANLLTIHADGTATVINETALSMYSNSVGTRRGCQSSLAGPEDNLRITISSNFTPASSYPSDYLAQYNSWAGAGVLQLAGAAVGQEIASGTALRILSVGDSITVGFLSDRDGGDGNGYRLQLRNDLSRKCGYNKENKERGRRLTFVGNKVVYAGTESQTGTMAGNYFVRSYACA